MQGRAPGAEPEAELWVGAHPAGPSALSDGTLLADWLTQAPAERLGAASLANFGPTLPFLLKVLAAAQPLSLQAHPSLAQARAGFAREEASGVNLASATRSYRDSNHKPELICALTPFHALCGFREPELTAELLRLLHVKALAPGIAMLEAGTVEPFFRWVMTQPAQAQRALAEAVAAAVRDGVPTFELEAEWATRIAALYPGDVGILGALSLNLVTLSPGEALFLPAGNLHAYLEGVGVEIMASSDNVLRGGLTPKHVDVPELLSVLRFEAGPVKVVTAHGEGEAVYDTPAPDFRLSRISGPATLQRWAVDVLLCVEGQLEVTSSRNSVRLQAGESLVAAADEGPIGLGAGGVVYRATVQP
jgi:mannose-6-phosphate isomerase